MGWGWVGVGGEATRKGNVDKAGTHRVPVNAYYAKLTSNVVDSSGSCCVYTLSTPFKPCEHAIHSRRTQRLGGMGGGEMGKRTGST